MLPTLWTDGLTVGEVAGIIGGSISLAHTLLPLLAALWIVDVVHHGQYSATTWTVASQQIQSSLWPALLRADASTTKHVQWRVQLASKIVLLSTAVFLAAHSLTPLPLVGDIRPSDKLEYVSFQYAPDLTFFGQGTMVRPENAVNRLCNDWSQWQDCPDSFYNALDGENYFEGQKIVNTTIPDITADAFSSGTVDSTIAGPLDIQFRQYYPRSINYVDGGAPQIQSNFRPLQSFLLESNFHLVEGVIVDTVNGGIGLRNHTVPMGLGLGASWSEDILFIEPVSSCTPTNLSINFRIAEDKIYNTFDGMLQDNGGFVHLATNPPSPSWALESGWNQSDPVPDVASRAQQAAWWNNHFTARVLGVADSYVGKGFPGSVDFFTTTYHLQNAITINEMNGNFLNDDLLGNGTTVYNLTGHLGRVNTSDYQAFGWRCVGYDNNEHSNPDKRYVRCGYLYGLPRPAQAGQSWQVTLGSPWTQELFTCASAVRAIVKTVQFSINSTSSLSALQVLNITTKTYHDPASEPLWGVEKVTGYNVTNIGLFWGMVSSNYLDNDGMVVRRSRALYLPAASQGLSSDNFRDGFAAGNAYQAAWNLVYESAALVAGVAVGAVPSYSGEANFALTLKYRNLTNTAEGAAKLLNLIWTDFAAFMTVGTKTGFEGNNQGVTALRRRNDDISALGTRAVYQHKHTVGYSNVYYAIPAFIACAAELSLLLLAVGLGCFGRIRWRMLHHYVNQTSMGRTATNMNRPAQPHLPGDPAASTEIWASTAGASILNVPRWRSSTARGSSLNHHDFQPLIPQDDREDIELRNRVPVPARHSRHFQSPLTPTYHNMYPDYFPPSAADAAPQRFESLRRTTYRRVT